MRTARSLPYGGVSVQGCLCPGGVCEGGSLFRGCLSGEGGVSPWQRSYYRAVIRDILCLTLEMEAELWDEKNRLQIEMISTKVVKGAKLCKDALDFWFNRV